MNISLLRSLKFLLDADYKHAAPLKLRQFPICLASHIAIFRLMRRKNHSSFAIDHF